MYAIVEIAGTQVKVEKSQKVYVPRLATEVGKTLTFDKVLLRSDESKTDVGSPYVEGSSVQVKVLAHPKDDKVIVFKKKKRKGYAVRRGHRQPFTHIEITNVS